MGTNNNGNNKTIAKNTLFLYLRMIIVLLVSLYATRVVLNVLGVTDYGIFSVVGGFVFMFGFLNSAMTNTTQRFYNFERKNSTVEERQETFNTALQIHIVLAIIILLLLETFGLWYINNKMVIPAERITAAKYVFQFSAISLVIIVLLIPFSASVISHERMDYFAVVSIIDVFLKLIVVLVLPYVPFDKLSFYGATTLLLSFINFFLYYFYSKKNFEEIRFKRIFAVKKFKQMLSFTGWNLFGSCAYMIQGQGLNVLMNAFFGPTVNAARGVAYQIQSAINGFSENIATAFRPQLVGSYANKDYDRTRSLLFSMSKFCFLMLCALSIPIVLELHYILDIWLKGVIPEDTIVFTLFVLANMLVGSLNMPISQTVQATGKVRNYQVIRSVLIMSTLPIAWVVLKMGLPPVSAFVVMLIISILNQPLSMAILHRQFDYSYKEYIKKVLFPCMSFMIFSPIPPLMIKLLFEESFIRLCIVGSVSIIVSIITAYFVILNKSEKMMAKEIVNGIIKKGKR